MPDKFGSEADVIAENTALKAQVDTLKADLDTAKTSAKTAEAELALEKTAHTKTKDELGAAVTERDKAKTDLAKTQTDLAAVTKERDELKAKDMDVDQRAAAKIVAIGIREPGKAAAQVEAKAKTVTELCREAAEKAKTTTH